jgi:molecular chaperone DnaK
LNETEVEQMLAEAEKYATADKEKRANIDLKNQAETLCFEAEKELDLMKDTVSEEKQQEIKTLIEDIRQQSQTDDFGSLQSSLEKLKMEMKDMVATQAATGTGTNSDPMSDLNDL